MIKIDNDFIELNKKLVYSIVNKYAKNYYKEDLYQVGFEALLFATKNYNEESGVKFTTYAYKYILGAVLKSIREEDIIKPSRDIIKNNKIINKYKNDVYMTTGKYPTNGELSKKLNISEKRINEIDTYCSSVKSLDDIIYNGDNEILLIDTIEKIENLSKEDLISLKDSIKKLEYEEKKYIYERYYENKTQTELANEYNTNQVKIYRYERSILDKLKRELV